MGLFSGKNFSFKNVITMPFDIAKNDFKFFGDLVKNPKDAFGKKQKGMTKILGGVGFNEDSKINKNSDAIMGVILGGIAAGGAMGAGAGGAAQGGAGGAAATGGQAAGAGAANAAPAAGGQSALTSGSWLNNPYVQAGQNLLQQRQQAQQQAMQSVSGNTAPQTSAARYAQQEQQGYNPYGRGGLLG